MYEPCEDRSSEIAEINIKSTVLKSLKLKEIQRILFWISGKAKKPSYIGIAYKEFLKSINIIILTDFIGKKSNLRSVNYLSENLCDDLKKEFNFKRCVRLIDNIDMLDIKNHLLKQTKSFLFDRFYEKTKNQRKRQKEKEEENKKLLVEEIDQDLCTKETKNQEKKDETISKYNQNIKINQLANNKQENVENPGKSEQTNKKIKVSTNNVTAIESQEGSGYLELKTESTVETKTKTVQNSLKENSSDNDAVLTPDLSLLTPENIKNFIVPDYNTIYNDTESIVMSSTSLLNGSLDISKFKRLDFKGKKTYHLLAIDCEMMESNETILLGRISMLDSLGNVVYDKYVLPPPDLIITDYKTEFSGLKEDSFTDLSKCVTFKQLQNGLEHIISPETVLLGHSLINDLVILQIIHEKIIDTSFIFRTKQNFRIGLKKLAKMYFDKDIQENIHCSVQDSLTCLQLLAIEVEEMLEFKNSKKYLDFGREIKIFENINEFEKNKNNRCINIYESKLDEIRKIEFKNTYIEVFTIIIFKSGNGKLYFLI